MRRPRKFHGLARPKLRQSWNKQNLFNLARAAGKEPQVRGRATFFQQKWAAKAKTRAYHGEHIPEKKWVRLFSRRLLSVVDMPPEYLAANDGSEQAAGRGSGLTNSTVTAESYSRVSMFNTGKKALTHPLQRTNPFADVNGKLSQHFEKMTPYMQMTFAPLERRLDTAIFRAMFATSTRQARQFVIHGAVKVNGKKMVHPAYQLNPGDMFQVDVEKVMYATGEQKKGQPNHLLEQALEKRKRKEKEALEKFRSTKAAAGEATDAEPTTENEGGEEGEEGEAVEAEELSAEDEMHLRMGRLRSLRKSVRSILQGDLKDFTAKQKKELRLFRDQAQRFLSLPEGTKLDSKELLDELQVQIQLLSSSVPAFKEADPAPEAETEGAAEEQSLTSEQKAEKAKEDEKRLEFKKRVLEKGLKDVGEKDRKLAHYIMETEELSKEEIRRLAVALRRDAENPIDESKPYVTPWRPRPFMAPFAFIPRYLEVNPNICAAVYLRHPVARKGLSEVPTPFNYLTSQLAHNWYLGRG